MHEDEEENHKFIVNGEEAKKQLTRGMFKQRRREQVHHIQRKVLPLLKPRRHHKHRKHGKHGSRKSGRREE